MADSNILLSSTKLLDDKQLLVAPKIPISYAESTKPY